TRATSPSTPPAPGWSPAIRAPTTSTSSASTRSAARSPPPGNRWRVPRRSASGSWRRGEGGGAFPSSSIRIPTTAEDEDEGAHAYTLLLLPPFPEHPDPVVGEDRVALDDLAAHVAGDAVAGGLEGTGGRTRAPLVAAQADGAVGVQVGAGVAVGIVAADAGK